MNSKKLYLFDAIFIEGVFDRGGYGRPCSETAKVVTITWNG